MAEQSAQRLLADLCSDLRLLWTQAGGPSLRTMEGQLQLSKSQLGAILAGRIRRPPTWQTVADLVVNIYEYAVSNSRLERLSLRTGVEEYWRPRYAMLEHAFSQSPVRTPSPALPDGQADSGASAHRPAQLPRAVRAFVGRNRELALLDAVLGDATCPEPTMPAAVVISAVSGTAGVGKTALAVQWAHRVRDRFPDGQLYIDLRGYDTSPPIQPWAALAQFLRALQVPAERVPLDTDEAAAMYRSLLADRRMLVLLDNAARPEQVRPLVPASPHCLVLVTSREHLGGLVASDGAHLLSLQVLPAEEAYALLAGILGECRAHAEPQAVAQLAQLCGFLPLALRVAAANLTVRPRLTIAEYVTELRAGNRLAELRVEGDDGTAVRNAFELSYRLLRPAARRLFRLLGLMPGPDISFDAVTALAGTSPEETRRALDHLVGGHLVDEPVRDRFSLHDLLRLYASSLAEDSPAKDSRHEALDRLCAFYLYGIDAAARLIYAETLRLPVPEQPNPPVVFADHMRALEWLDTERTSLVALVHRAAEHGPRAAAWQLADALRGYFYFRRHIGDWLSTAVDGLRAAEADGHPAAQSAAHMSLGVAYNMRADHELASAHLANALTFAEKAGWQEAQAAALNNLGTVCQVTGRPRQAAEYFSRTVAVHRHTGRVTGQAIALDNLGIVRRDLGELRSAANLHAQALALYEQAFPIGQATALMNLGDTCSLLGLLDEAMRCYTRARTMHTETGNRDRETICMYGMAVVHRAYGNHDTALRMAVDALAQAREIGDRRTTVTAMVVLAAIHRRLDHHDRTLDLCRQALLLAQKTDNRHGEAAALIALANAELGADHTDVAHTAVLQALAIVCDTGYRILEADALTALAGIHLTQGQTDGAIASARRALAIRRETGYRLDESRTLRMLEVDERERFAATPER